MKKEKKNKNKNGMLVLEIVLGSIVLISFTLALLTELIVPDAKIAIWMKNNVWNLDSFLATMSSSVSMLLHGFLSIVIVYAACKVVRIILNSRRNKNSKTKKIVPLVDGFIKYGCAIAIIFIALKAFGVNTTALITSAGVLTLVIGLGAQSLIADIIAGIFIIFEGEYEVGEIVSIDDFRGEVIEIGIRTTRLKDTAGNIKIINNSDINNVVNMSRELSLAVVECEFPYDVPQEFIEKILNDNLESLKEKIPAIVEGPFYKGVSAYEDSNVAVKLVAKCREEDRYQVQRDLLREYRMIFVKNGVDLSFQQVVLSQAVKTNYKLNQSDKNKANEFVNEQKEKSHNIDEQEH